MWEMQRRTHAVSVETNVLTKLHSIVRETMQLCNSDKSVRTNNFRSHKSNFDHSYSRKIMSTAEVFSERG